VDQAGFFDPVLCILFLESDGSSPSFVYFKIFFSFLILN